MQVEKIRTLCTRNGYTHAVYRKYTFGFFSLFCFQHVLYSRLDTGQP